MLGLLLKSAIASSFQRIVSKEFFEFQIVVESIQTLSSAEFFYIHFTVFIHMLFSLTLPANGLICQQKYWHGMKERIGAACQLVSCESKKPPKIQSQQKLSGLLAISSLVMVLQSTLKKSWIKILRWEPSCFYEDQFHTK